MKDHCMEECPLVISFKPRNPQTERAAMNLQQLVRQHKLLPFLFTKHVLVTSQGTCTSHPHLTISAPATTDAELLLGIFLHEQFHWYVAQRSSDLRDAVSRFSVLWPHFADLTPPSGASTPSLTYIHLVVCQLEQLAMALLIGNDGAMRIRQRATRYLAVYESITTSANVIIAIIQSYNLLPESLEYIAQQAVQPDTDKQRVFGLPCRS